MTGVATDYARSPWVTGLPKSHVPSHPRLRGPIETSVAIVGGGLTGCATAYAFAAAGVKVALVEHGRVGGGSAGSALGWIAADPAESFIDVEKTIGRRDARSAWQAWRRAALDLAALVRRLKVKCGVEAGSALILAVTPEQATRLKREQAARRDAGLDAPLVRGREAAAEAGIDAAVAWRSRDGATLDPYRLALGLAAAAVDRGALVFEQSSATRTRFSRKWIDVQTEGGTIRADLVVIATGGPTRLFPSLERHYWFKRSFMALTGRLPADVRRQLGSRRFVIRDSAAPPHLVRWVGDDRLLVSGGDSEAVRDGQREKTIVQRTGQLMYELSVLYPAISGIPPAYGWDAAYWKTAHGLPSIGPHRNFPRHLFAFGDASHSVTGAYLASRILLRHYLQETEASDEVFRFRL